MNIAAVSASTVRRRPPWLARVAAFTLAEVMIALLVLATALVAFLGTFIHSRRVTESSVIHAAATSLVYGLVEQIKGLDYTTLLPSTATDPDAPVTSSPPYVRLRVNQDLSVWLQCVYTTSAGTPAAPTTTPLVSATAASLSAIDNVIGPLPLSTTTGARSQQLSVNVWLWIDEIPSTSLDVQEVKKITLVYTCTFNDGIRTRSIRDREVVIRSRYDQ